MRKYVASFVGLVPAKKPRLAILVMVDEPHGNIYGGVVAAPAFRDIARFALQYLEVPPDAPETKVSQTAAAGPLEPVAAQPAVGGVGRSGRLRTMAPCES